MIKWFYQYFGNGRCYAGNGSVKIFATSIDNRNRLIRKYRHFRGIVSQRRDGSVREIAFEEGYDGTMANGESIQ